MVFNIKGMIYLAHTSLQSAAKIALGTTLLEKHVRKDLRQGCTFSQVSLESLKDIPWLDFDCCLENPVWKKDILENCTRAVGARNLPLRGYLQETKHSFLIPWARPSKINSIFLIL